MLFQGVRQFLETADTESPCPHNSKAWIEAVKDYAETCLDEFDNHFVDIGCEILARFVAFDKRGVEERRKHVTDLLDRKQQGQRTTEWYAEAATMLTASEFADIFTSPLSRGRLVMKKAVPPPIGPRPLACKTADMNALSWGIRFEPVAKQILEKEWGAVIGECGRLYHPTRDRLAASPDGFITDSDDKTHVGRLLEIKCPISRKIGAEIPHKYWIQMQIQMEVRGVDECDYVEVSIESPVEPERAEGYVWVMQRPLVGVPGVDYDAKYEYELTYAYTAIERDSLVGAGWQEIEKVGWAKKELSHHVVPIDGAWFASTLTAQKEFWEDVERARRGEFQAPVSSRAKKCLIED
jgi:hypothetical protein